MKTDEFILYGLDDYKRIIDKIICSLNAYADCFDIKLILTEALTNAFKHGNKGAVDKPIYLRYRYDGKKVEFEIQDSGNGFEAVSIPENLSDEKILDSYGRGLFLVNCIADKIEFKNSTLVIQKKLSNKKVLS